MEVGIVPAAAFTSAQECLWGSCLLTSGKKGIWITRQRQRGNMNIVVTFFTFLQPRIFDLVLPPMYAFRNRYIVIYQKAKRSKGIKQPHHHLPPYHHVISYVTFSTLFALNTRVKTRVNTRKCNGSEFFELAISKQLFYLPLCNYHHYFSLLSC